MANGTKLRSEDWFGGFSYESTTRRAWMRSQGFGPQVFQGRPVVGICNSFSELNNCNAHLRELAEAVKRGVWAAGGFPLEFPTISLGEVFMKPTTMLFRNLMAMDVEESIRANPIDGVVLLAGCDKTTPAQLMGAASADIPALMVTGGPMLAGNWKGNVLGSGTDGRKYFQEVRAGRITEEQWCEIESCIARSAGHCTVMGTASTMASMAEALGMAPTGNAAIPAVDSRRYQLAEAAGRRIVEMIREDLRPSQVLTRAAFENAIKVDMAIGGSTNAVVHLMAIAGRAGVDLSLSDFDRLSRQTPFLANVKPSGEYVMEDFFYAGGLPAVMRELLPLLDGTAVTVTGRTVAENLQNVEAGDRKVVRALGQPFTPRAARRSSTGRWPPTAPSSSRPPPRPDYCNIAAGPWSSPASTSSRPASTTPRSRSTRTRSWSSKTPAPAAAPACPSGAICRFQPSS